MMDLEAGGAVTPDFAYLKTKLQVGGLKPKLQNKQIIWAETETTKKTINFDYV